MKFKDYLKELDELVKKHPKALEMDLIYSIDDEGNSFHRVYWGASIGYFKDNAFIASEHFEENNLDKDTVINAVCLN